MHVLAGENDKHIEFTYQGTTFSIADPYAPDVDSDGEDNSDVESDDGSQSVLSANEAEDGADDLGNDGQDSIQDDMQPDEEVETPDAIPVDLDEEIGPETDESVTEGDDPKEIEGESDDNNEPVRSTRSAPSGRFYRLDESNRATLAAQLKKNRPDPM